MNKLWDDLKDNMKEWGASAVEKAEEISRVAVAKGEEFTKISKIKIEIIQLQKEISKKYVRLGKMVYNHAQNDNMTNFAGNSEFFDKITEINHLINKINKNQKEIDRIKKIYGIKDSDLKSETSNIINDKFLEEE